MMVAPTGLTRPVVYILLFVTLLAVITVLVHSEPVHAELSDPEPPAQYETHSTAYTLSEQELGSPLMVRKEGGGDRDYIKIPFLEKNDLVSVSVDQKNASNQVEYWVEDPNHFPIFYYQYNGPPDPPQFEIQFAAIISGPYFLYHGQGFGTTVISVNFSVQPGSSMGDGNDRPDDAAEVNRTVVENGTFGLPDDPADFFRLELDPSPDIKTFLSIYVSTGVGTEAQWEMYNSTGILRQDLTYSGDVIAIGADAETFDERMEERGTLYLRLWCWRGGGDYQLFVNIENYPEDGDDEMETARVLVDGQTVNGTLHTRFDEADHLRIDLDGGDTLSLTMDVGEDLDLFVLHSDGYQVASSRNWYDESEHISYVVPPDWGGTYIVRVVMSSELDPLPFREISYRLHAVANLPPGLDPDYASTYRSWPMLEDWVDEGILLTDLFFDPEGGPLSFLVVPGHNESYLEVTVTGAMRLRLEPAENVSGFVEDVTVEAVDDAGKRTRFTISVAVLPENDPPVAWHPTAAPPPEHLEVAEDSTGGPWDVLFWFWDSDNEASELEFAFETGPELGARTDVLYRLLLDAVQEDWNGGTDLTIRVTDPEGLGALLRIPVSVLPVNDAPELVVTDFSWTIEDRAEATIDLGDMFVDVDGDTLGYIIVCEQDLRTSTNGSALTVERLFPFQHQTVVLAVRAEDGSGETSEPLTVTIEVGEVPEPHNIVPSLSEYTVLRGGDGVHLEFGLDDPDGPGHDYTVEFTYSGTKETYLYNNYESPGTWTPEVPVWRPAPVGGDGDVIVTMVVKDEWYADSVSWTIHVRSHNSPPVVVAVTPDRPGPYQRYEEIQLTVEAHDDDGDELTYYWTFTGSMTVRDHEEGGPTWSVRSDQGGRNQVVVEVTDGFESTTAFFNFTVTNEPDGGGPNAAAIVLVLSVVAIVSVFVLINRRGKA
jgi:hypothetical protein